jgi:PAS domain S-box-containing protein
MQPDDDKPTIPPPPSLAQAPVGALSGTPVTDADYRRMVEAIGDYAIFLLDEHGHIRTWNLGAERYKGYRAEEVIGRHFRLFYPQELVDRGWPEHELEVAREVGRFEDEGWRVRKDGSQFWANIIITRLLDERGELRGFSKITRDLSERRLHEEALRTSEERFRLLVEGVHDYAIFLLDPDGRIASWNSGAQRNKGYRPDEVIGRHFSMFYPPGVAAAGWPAEELRRALAQGSFEDEGWRVRKDGSRFWASVVITPLYDEHGVHRGFAKVTRDLTDKRRISSLEDEGRRISTFLAMLGHELRNPLAPIANALAVMEVAAPDSEHVRLARAVISRQVKQMTRLVDDLLDVGRISSGKIHLDMRPLKLADALADAMEAAEPLARARGHALAVKATDPDLWISGDRARIIQVIGNLLGNAIKFTPAGGQISASLARNKDRAELSIKDSGVGIPEPMLSDIFNPFVQGDQDAARSHGGLGLGLSLVHQIVALHGGHVSVYSSTQWARGSEFVVSFPAVAPAPAETADAAPAKCTGGHKVLVVDDNQDAANTMAAVLEATGYRVHVVYDGLAALAAVEAFAPDAVLLDIGLPGLSGVQVAERLRAEMDQPPRLVAVTGYGTDADRLASERAGFAAHLTKPVDLGELTALLERLFA